MIGLKLICVTIMLIFHTRALSRAQRDVKGPPSRTKFFVEYHRHLMGYYYSGVAEFPWVAEIRTINDQDFLEQEEWSTGNMLSSTVVLTTCNAVGIFVLNQGRYQVIPKNESNHKVVFSSINPHLISFVRDTEKKLFTNVDVGSRSIRRMAPHPYCTYNQMRYHFGVVHLNESIFPIPPRTLYMPLEMEKYRIKRVLDQSKKKYWIPCKLATWGRKYGDGFSNDMLMFFKIKFDVRFVEMQNCMNEARNMDPLPWLKNADKMDLYCMQLDDAENTMGAICDHDRGSPIVCSGTVVGMMMRGVNLASCTNLSPRPFIVMDITDVLEYYSHINRFILSTYKIGRFPITHSDGRHPGCSLLSASIVFWSIFILTTYL